MYKALGIVNSPGRNYHVYGLEAYRPIGAFSFLGRYRVVDFPLSNLSNSDIDQIQVYIGDKPLSMIEHLQTGRHYNINSKHGKLQMLFSEDGIERNYNTDIAAYIANMDYISSSNNPYVVIVPGYMVFTQNFRELIKKHVDSGSDITLLYHRSEHANEQYLNCNILNMDSQKNVDSIELNRGLAKSRNIFMDTYIMKKELFVQLINKAYKLSSMYTLSDIVSESCKELNVHAEAHRGFFAAINDFKSYFDSNLSLLNLKTTRLLFDQEWPIFTRTNDSCPTQYYESSDVRSSIISNGCLIAGSIENSILGRGCIIKEGAVIKNCVILSGVTVSENTHIENQVIDKSAKVLNVKEIISPIDHPGYIKKRDTL